MRCLLWKCLLTANVPVWDSLGFANSKEIQRRIHTSHLPIALEKAQLLLYVRKQSVSFKGSQGALISQCFNPSYVFQPMVVISLQHGYQVGCLFGHLWLWWWTGRPGVLWFMGSQRVGHKWATELNWTDDFIFWGSKFTAGGDCSHEIKRRLLLGRKVMTNLDSILKSRDISLPTKVRLVKAIVFSSGHVWMWELDYKESWVLKNWCFWTVVLEKTLESPLDC